MCTIYIYECIYIYAHVCMYVAHKTTDLCSPIGMICSASSDHTSYCWVTKKASKMITVPIIADIIARPCTTLGSDYLDLDDLVLVGASHDGS